MADTVDTGLLPRTYFKAPRVPFDFRALALAMLGYLIYWGGSLLLHQVFGDPDPVRSFLGAAASVFVGLPFIGDVIHWFLGVVFGFGDVLNAEGSFWHKLIGGVWIFVVWSYFGQAIHRITSLRIARDEGLGFVQAFVFSARNWVTVLLAPVIVALTIAFFYGCNALAGLIISIPFGGQILALILIPLALISALLILLIGIGGVFGLPLIGAAAAWERNGTLDAISRAFSYIFARPLQFFWNYFLIFLFVGVILLVGSWFVTVLTKSVDAGVVSPQLSVLIDPPTSQNDVSSDLVTTYTDLEASTGFSQGRGEHYPKEHHRKYEPLPLSNPWVKHWDAVAQGGWKHGLNAIIFWVAVNLIWIGIFGYAIYWFLGATTSVYADLRADVDGTEEDEIYLEEEEEDFDALAEAAGHAEPLAGGEPAPDTAPDTASDTALDTASDTASDATADDVSDTAGAADPASPAEEPSAEGDGGTSPDASPDTSGDTPTPEGEGEKPA